MNSKAGTKLDEAPSLNVTGANDRIRVAVIGIGRCGPWWSLSFPGNSHKLNTTCVAVCDLYEERRKLAARNNALTGDDAVADYRRLLDRKDIDGILVATHDPWHAQICMDALDAGKHVSCAIPTTRYLDEAFRVYDKARSSKSIFHSFCFPKSAAWRETSNLVRGGKLGQLVALRGNYSRNNPRGEWNYLAPFDFCPEQIAWEEWLGPVKHRPPFNKEHFFRWQKYYAYSAGPLGYLGSMRLHELLYGTGHPEFPIRVNCISTKHVDTDGSEPQREVSADLHLQAEFASGCTLSLDVGTVNAKYSWPTYYGTRAALEIQVSGNHDQIIIEDEFDSRSEKRVLDESEPIQDRVPDVLTDWYSAIRDNKPPLADIDLAIRVQTIVSLAEMSDRLKMTCRFDPETRTITNGNGKMIPPITYGTLGQS